MTTLALDLSQHLALRPLPQLVASASFLTLSADEVEAAIESELAVNPALERAHPARSLPPLTELAGLAAPTAPRALLAADARVSLPASEHAIVEHVVGSLDAHGFLRESPEDVARRAGVAVDRVERAIAAVRAAGPPGTAARDVRECLLLQLDEWPSSRLKSLVRALVERHLEDLARGRTHAIAAALGVDADAVESAAETLRTRLRPYPVEETEPWERPEPAPPVDIVVTAADDDLDVEIVGASPARFRETVPGDDRARARELLDRVERRRRTLHAVAEATVRRQREFVLNGAPVQPLTHSAIAAEVGLHASTVSRAVADRFVRLPSGRVVALAALFARGTDTTTALAALVQSETRARSDADLARELARRGHRVARRTVAKYRAALGIPPQHERRAKLASA